MRLKRLDLKAFGPFTDRILEFHSKAPGLHVIFGPNESGKSSSLRGLRALLFGFPTKTPDNFLHSYDQLLVGGVLANRDGKELVFQRRKKRNNDLLDEQGEPLDSSILIPFLQGIESEIFQSLYGIDHDSLVRGGREILDQQGEVGKSLFAAGAGISSLRGVIEQLEQEAADLFKPRGSNPQINKAIKRYKELQKEIKEASLAPKDWKELKKSLDDAESSLGVLENERYAKSKELGNLIRLRQAIPELAALRVWRDKLKNLGDVVELPADVQDRKKLVEQAIYQAESQYRQSSERLQLIEGKLQAISINNTLLEQGDLVDDFHQRLGEYRKGQYDSPQLNGMRISLRSQASSFLKQIRPDMDLNDVNTLRPALAKKRAIQTLITQFEAISQNLTQTKKRNQAAQKDMEEIDKVLSEAPIGQDTQELTVMVKLARKAGDIDTHISKAFSEIERGYRECRADLKRAGLWTGDITTLVELPLPLVQTIQEFERKFREIAEDRRTLTQERKNAVLLLKSAETELKRIEYCGEVPSEQDLQEIRKRRDTGWQLLCRQWLAGEDVSEESQVFAAEQSLPERYESLVHQADTVADRLRNEADRVANSANFKAQIEQQVEVLEAFRVSEKESELLENELLQEWKNVWTEVGITPLSPSEMAGWINTIEQLRIQIKYFSNKEKDVAGEVRYRQELLEKLMSILVKMTGTELPSSEKLAPVLIVAERIIEKNNEQLNKRNVLLERRKKAEKVLAETNEELNEAEHVRKSWQEQWQKTISVLGIKEDISPLEATDYLEAIQNCIDREREAADLKKRIDGIERDANHLEKEVRGVLTNIMPSLCDLPLDQAILQLRALLKKAQEDKSLHDQLLIEKESVQTEKSLAERRLQEANRQMETLLKTAKCKTVEELDPVITRFLEYQKLQEKISACEETLIRIGEGTTAGELAAQAERVDSDELAAQIEALQQDIEERIYPAVTGTSEKIGELKNKLAIMDGGARAADVSEKLEQELAKIRRLVERYTRVKLASKVLQQEIERYREKHQDPLLKLASKYFAELTMQSFAGLRADVNDKGEIVLEGIREDGKWTGITGMSDGTRDQLYLSLRLATLEWRIETGEPFPFIVDDILINFDDDRSRATLHTLARFGRKNQVILFTHHHQLVDDAKIVGKTEEVIVHTL